jgi:signal peptidase II
MQESYFSKKSKWVLCGSMIFLIFIMDQLTKFLILTQYPFGFVMPICKFLNIVHMRNHGVSFGMLQSHTAIKQWLLIIIALAISVWIIRMLLQTRSKYEFFGFSMILAGALGNIVDRLRFGYVVDFIELYINEKLRWPAFNVADSSIVSGVGIVLVAQFLLNRKQSCSLSGF